MPQRVRGDWFVVQRRAARRRRWRCAWRAADAIPERVSGCPCRVGNSGSSGWPWRSLSHGAEDCDGLGGQGRGSAFATLALDLDVRAGGEAHVADGEGDQFGDAHPSQDSQSSSAWSRRPNQVPRSGAASSALISSLVEVGEAGPLVAFERDRHHPADRREVLGVAQRGVPVERVDRRQPDVAGPGAVAAVGARGG